MVAKEHTGGVYDMEKHLAALCALCLLLWGGAALAETEIILSDAGVTAARAWR